jgi:hypothetical protein
MVVPHSWPVTAFVIHSPREGHPVAVTPLRVDHSTVNILPVPWHRAPQCLGADAPESLIPYTLPVFPMAALRLPTSVTHSPKPWSSPALTALPTQWLTAPSQSH